MSFKSLMIKKIKSLEKDFFVYNHIYLSKSALLGNFDILKKFSPNEQIIPVLKSNAYGHGLEKITEILKDRKFPYIAVDGYFEALKIRDISKQPVLIMGSIDLENYSRINSKNFTFVVHDKNTIETIAKTKKKFCIHIEIDSGMNRHGVKFQELDKIIKVIKKYPKIKVTGVMSHLADADNYKNKFTEQQIKIFDEAVKKIIDAGIKPKYIHIANSAGCTKTKSKFSNCTRIGLALYGISPLSNKDKNYHLLKNLKPVLSVKSKITKIIQINKGESVGYSRTFVSKNKTTIGIIPFGYYEGIKRVFSNNGKVKINNKYYPIVGKVCMNHTMIDLKNENINVGSIVTIIESNNNEDISIEKICKKYGLFSYEFLVNLNQNIRREITD